VGVAVSSAPLDVDQTVSTSVDAPQDVQSSAIDNGSSDDGSASAATVGVTACW
jgi:hypothetical protein